MRKALFLISVVFSTTSLLAQEVLDTTYLKCEYKLSYSFDTIQNAMRNDLFILQIGKKVSKCYSYYTFQSDSLWATPNGQEVFTSIVKKAAKELHGKDLRSFIPHSRSTTFIYKNYPPGELTVTDRISTNDYIFHTHLDGQNWQIGNKTKEILGYPCQKAECDFRGRHYTAWFTPDIPVSDGPWKFTGLPGLIMEVSDRGNQYHFIITGVEQVKEPIVFSEAVSSSKRYIKTSRKRLLKAKRNYIVNMNGYVKAETGIDLNFVDDQKVMRYDFLERDYNKK